jgi:hypothetical protein
VAQERRCISKSSMKFHGLTVGSIRSYSDGSATCKLKKDDPLVQAMFTTLVSQVTNSGFVQDPQIPHMFTYQMPVEEAKEIIEQIEGAQATVTQDEIDNIRKNEEENIDGTD